MIVCLTNEGIILDIAENGFWSQKCRRSSCEYVQALSESLKIKRRHLLTKNPLKSRFPELSSSRNFIQYDFGLKQGIERFLCLLVLPPFPR